MIPYFVSFNPEIPMEENLPILTRLGDPGVRQLLGKAAGVLLPGYTPPWRYRGITHWARQWFPRLGARFIYRGKTRQILLFRELGQRHPESLLFKNRFHLQAYCTQWGSPWGYPLVLKGDTGGGGSTVYPVYHPSELLEHLQKLPDRQPVLLQRWIEHGGRDLRVVVYGDHAISYFRMGDGRFYNNVCRGGRIDHAFRPEQQNRGIEAVLGFCRRTRIDIAGFDLMFPDDGSPVFVEINFHFGRKGLGGAPGHRRHVRAAVDDWRVRCLRSYDASK